MECLLGVPASAREIVLQKILGAFHPFRDFMLMHIVSFLLLYGWGCAHGQQLSCQLSISDSMRR